MRPLKVSTRGRAGALRRRDFRDSETCGGGCDEEGVAIVGCVKDEGRDEEGSGMVEGDEEGRIIVVEPEDCWMEVSEEGAG